MTETPELLPCPHCGSTNISKWAVGNTHQCTTCGAAATDAHSWNTRVPPSTVGMEGSLFEMAAHLCALEDAEMYKPIPAELIERGRMYIRAGLREKHSGDCTNESHSCVVCGTQSYLLHAKQILEALSLSPTLASEKEGGEAALAKVQAAADTVVSRIVEWDDRTSPDDFPEALLITPSELHRELVRFATDIGALAPPAASLIAKGEGK